jgi:hypothetical protein
MFVIAIVAAALIGFVIYYLMSPQVQVQEEPETPVRSGPVRNNAPDELTKIDGFAASDSYVCGNYYCILMDAWDGKEYTVVYGPDYGPFRNENELSIEGYQDGKNFRAVTLEHFTMEVEDEI